MYSYLPLPINFKTFVLSFNTFNPVMKIESLKGRAVIVDRTAMKLFLCYIPQIKR